MKPLNANSQSCDPISSNCVIWQGPDIECIKLCKGDTISDIVAKLATELCLVLDTLDVKKYQLSCFNITSCDPKDFHALIQFLIGRICQLEACNPDCVDPCITNGTTPTRSPILTASGCPDCTIAIAPCFYYVNEFGDTVTQMQLIDYVYAIGNKICLLAGQIETINLTLQNFNIRITTLENTPPPVYELPTFIPVCVLPAVPTDIATILQALEAQFCALRAATGTPEEIYQAIAYQCSGLGTAAALGTTGGNMASIPGWVNSPATAADTLTNIWLTICDLRSAVANIKLTCCPGGCDGIEIRLQLTLVDTTLTLFFTGTLPAGFQNCLPSGTVFTITDTSGGLVNVSVDLVSYMNVLTGYPINLTATPIDILNNLTVTGSPCFENIVTNTTCQSYISEIYYNVPICPAFILTPSTTSIDYAASVPVGTADYTIEVWNSTSTLLITSYTQTIVGPGTFLGSIGGLTSGTLYKVRLVITIDGVPTACPYQSLTTLGYPCDAPDTVVATIII